MKIRKILKIILSIVIILGVNITCTYAFSGLEQMDITVDINQDITTNFSLPRKFVNIVGKMQERYNLKDFLNIYVKNQGATNRCWAMSTNTAIETTVNRQRNSNLILSEEYLDVQTDKLYAKEDGMGNVLIALGYYTSGNSPQTTEGEDADIKINNYEMFPTIYKTKEGEEIKYINKTGFFNRNYYTEEQVNTVRNQIKEQVMKYGAVTATMYSTLDDRYYGEDGISFYSDDFLLTPANHQVTIIGWDDNYAIENFNSEKRPLNPGAYIVQNSYGEEMFNNGIFYVSYDDCNIEAAIFGITEVAEKDYDAIYQHDELGINNSLSAKVDAYGANVFTRTTSDKERLKEISIATTANGEYEIYINPQDGELSEDKLKKVGTLKTNQAGYHTFKLTNPIILNGEKFVVAVKYIKGSDELAHIGMEYNDEKVWAKAESSAGESYISTDMKEWMDLKSMATDIPDLETANLCIKAFTEDANKREYVFENTGYIKNILPNTTGKVFKMNAKAESIEIDDTQIIKTGMKLIVNGNEYIAVVLGDIDGDGQITLIDLAKMKQHIVKMNGKILEKEKLQAADINLDNNADLIDLGSMKRVLVGLKDL